jgi:hypothetical protein
VAENTPTAAEVAWGIFLPLVEIGTGIDDSNGLISNTVLQSSQAALESCEREPELDAWQLVALRVVPSSQERICRIGRAHSIGDLSAVIVANVGGDVVGENARSPRSHPVNGRRSMAPALRVSRVKSGG